MVGGVEENMEQLGFNAKKMKRSFIVGITTLPIVLVITLMVFSRNPSLTFSQGFNYIYNSNGGDGGASNKARVFAQNENATASAPARLGGGGGDHRNMTAASAPADDPHRNASVASDPAAEDHRDPSAPSSDHPNATGPSPSSNIEAGRNRGSDMDAAGELPPVSRNDSAATSRNNNSHAPSPTTTTTTTTATTTTTTTASTPTTNPNDSISSPTSLKNSPVREPNYKDPTTDGTNENNDKLLDRLIPPGFNEASCASRYTSYRYRNGPSSRHKPSPYLVSKLRSYENLHRRCGPHSKRYAKAMRKLAKSKGINPSGTDDSGMKYSGRCKYMVWTAENGLGNRMISMVSIFLYAVLTDRVFLVEFEKPMTGLFCEPFLNSTWELPDDFPSYDAHHFNHHLIPTYEEFWKMRDSSGSTNDGGHQKHHQLGLPSMMFLDLGRGNDVLSHPFHCDQNQGQILGKVPVLVVRTDQYIVPSLYMSHAFKEELDKMFPEKETVFYHLGRYLFHPSNQVWGLITGFYDAHLARSDQIIGLQIRVFSPKSVSFRTIMDQILACSDRNNILPQVLLSPSSASNNNQTTPPPKTISILVTSLYPTYAEALKKMYRSHPTANGDRVEVCQPSYEGEQKFYNNTHNIKALADMYLLSLCDVLVTSGVSTFGYVAQGLGGLKPWILQKLDRDDNVRNPSCYLDLSSEPCNHFPPAVDCEGNRIKNVSEVWDFMRPCRDWIYGVKNVGV